MLNGIDVEGKHVLDVGGLGAADILLIQRFGAARYRYRCGTASHRSLPARARETVLAVKQISPRRAGPAAFEASSFDIVFSKDAIVHTPDVAFYADVFEKVRPGGLFVGSDGKRAKIRPPKRH